MIVKLLARAAANALETRKSAIAGAIGAQSIVLGAYINGLVQPAIQNTKFTVGFHDIPAPIEKDVKSAISAGIESFIGNLCSEIRTEAPKQIDALIAILRR